MHPHRHRNSYDLACFCVSFLFQISKETTVENVVFHSGASSAVQVSSSPCGTAHVMYLSKTAPSTLWKDNPSTWGAHKAQISPVAVALSGRSVFHVGGGRGCIAQLVCSRMASSLSCLNHMEVDFEHPTWVDAMRDAVSESSLEHLVIKQKLVR